MELMGKRKDCGRESNGDERREIGGVLCGAGWARTSASERCRIRWTRRVMHDLDVAGSALVGCLETSRRHAGDGRSVTTTGSRVIPPSEHDSVPDAGRLEQVLRFHDALLLGDVAPTSVAARICQGVAILLHAETVRLLVVDDERVDVVASYGTPASSAIDVAEL